MKRFYFFKTKTLLNEKGIATLKKFVNKETKSTLFDTFLKNGIVKEVDTSSAIFKTLKEAQ